MNPLAIADYKLMTVKDHGIKKLDLLHAVLDIRFQALDLILMI